MTLFEFVTVMVSMILALCLGNLLRSASFLAKTDRAIVRYPPHGSWSIVILFAVVNHWWSLWDLRAVEWSYASFVYILVAPALITFATGLLSPDLSGSTPVDLRAHYARIRRLFSAVMVAYTGFMWFDGPLFAGQAPFGTVGLMHVPIIVAFAVPGMSANERVNFAAASMAIAVLSALMIVRYATM